MMDLKGKIKQVIVEELHLDHVTPDEIDDEAPLFGDGLALDSLDALQLAVVVEDHFGIRIGDENVGRTAFASINALAKFIEDNTDSAKNSSAAG